MAIRPTSQNSPLETENQGNHPSSAIPSVGIDGLSFYVPGQYLPLEELAKARDVDVGKFHTGLGQEKMAVLSPDEDIITLAAEAARPLLTDIDLSSLDAVILATESGVDQSKAGAIYIHGLLDLPSSCKAFEVKQACCSSTAAIQMALATVTLKPTKRILVIASDVARYGILSAGEPTQGAGAVAIMVSANPRLIAMDPEDGSYTRDVMDFWRPNYRDEALVDGKYSIKIYLEALENAFQSYQNESGRSIDDLYRFCYHLPFTRMGEKAHSFLHKKFGAGKPETFKQIEDSGIYNRQIGNCYTAALYLAITSLLENEAEDLSGKRVGLFSYGSGCMGTFFSGKVQAGYRDHLLTHQHQALLASREPLSIESYERMYQHALPIDGEEFQNPQHARGKFRLAGIEAHRRIYTADGPDHIPSITASAAELVEA